MGSQNEMLSKDLEKFLLAAERLIVHDVRPELLQEGDLAVVQCYLETLLAKFTSSKASADTSQAALF